MSEWEHDFDSYDYCAIEDPRREDCMYDVLGVETGECFCEYECERRARGLEVIEPDDGSEQ